MPVPGDGIGIFVIKNIKSVENVSTELDIFNLYDIIVCKLTNLQNEVMIDG